jgi:ribonuclease BN (tRNA processing enzyme)
LEITVLGCSGAELPGHNAPGFLLDGKILFDAGSLTGVLDEKSQWKIRDIFITHAHLDHIKSIPFLAGNIVFKRHKHTVCVYSVSAIINVLSKNLLNDAMWPDFSRIPNPEKSVISLIKMPMNVPLEKHGYSITPIKVTHTVPAVGYLVRKNTAGSSGAAKTLFYTGDTGPTEAVWKKLGDTRLDCLIIESSFPNKLRDMAVNTGHLTPQLLRKEISKLTHMPATICITHIKPQHQKQTQAELKALKLNNLVVLKDGDKFKI